MQTTKNLTLGVVSALVGLTLGACGGSVEVKGRITDEVGQQQQGLGSGAPVLGGQGTAAAATRVTASTVAPGGSLTVVAEAEVTADHTYSLELARGTERVVLQALDAQGEVVASALLDAAVTAEGQTARTAPAMSSESSLEAEVFVKMVVDGAAVHTVDTVDLRSRITSKLAQEARAQSSEAQTRTVASLAAAARSAQESEVKAYAKAGVTVTQDELFQASLEASAKLDAALEATGTNATQAYADFFAAIQGAMEESTETQEAEAERAASASFRAVVDARLNASVDTQPAADAAIRSAALLEARANDVAVRAVLQAAGATQPMLTQASTAYDDLRGKLASSGSGVGAAFSAYSVALTANGSASVLGGFLQVGTTGSANLGTALTACTTAFGTLDAALTAVLETNLLANLLGSVNTTAVAEGMVNAYAAYHDSVRTHATAALQATAGTKTSAAVEVLVVANGHMAF
ncbi:MAG: hypothetical protein L0Y66_15060 [Myxococcaceae bacterium]|nr:hypothetical protein [Myxococcaceae bacterium]